MLLNKNQRGRRNDDNDSAEKDARIEKKWRFAQENERRTCGNLLIRCEKSGFNTLGITQNKIFCTLCL